MKFAFNKQWIKKIVNFLCSVIEITFFRLMTIVLNTGQRIKWFFIVGLFEVIKFFRKSFITLFLKGLIFYKRRKNQVLGPLGLQLGHPLSLLGFFFLELPRPHWMPSFESWNCWTCPLKNVGIQWWSVNYILKSVLWDQFPRKSCNAKNNCVRIFWGHP